MDRFARCLVVGDAGEQDCQLNAKGLEDHEAGGKQQKDTRHRRSQNQNGARDHEALVGFGVVAER